MNRKNLKEAKSLSLIARLAVALHCFEGCCNAWGLESPLIREFLDYMWEWPVKMTAACFGEWESKSAALVEFGLGGEIPGELKGLPENAGVTKDLFGHLTQNTVEIIWGSFYGASDNEGSLEELASVMAVASACGFTPPALEEFGESRFKDKHGWGCVLTREQRDRWRNLCGISDLS